MHETQSIIYDQSSIILLTLIHQCNHQCKPDYGTRNDFYDLYNPQSLSSIFALHTRTFIQPMAFKLPNYLHLLLQHLCKWKHKQSEPTLAITLEHL